MSDPRTYLSPGTDTQSFTCRVAVAGVHKAPDSQSAIDDQLLYGHGFNVARIEDAWAYGQVVAPVGDSAGYVGYVKSEYLKPQVSSSNSHKIISLKAPVFSAPDIKSPIKMILSLGSECAAPNVSGDFFDISEGFIHKSHIAPREIYAEDFVSIAERYMLLPYIWGGKSGDGVDCSGLVQNALWAAGIDCPRDADQQEAALGTPVPITDDLSGLRRGDIVFWKGHVGIMMDDAWLLHANAYHMMTDIEPLEVAQKRIAVTGGPITAIKRLAV